MSKIAHCKGLVFLRNDIRDQPANIFTRHHKSLFHRRVLSQNDFDFS